jgi:hypothetical protein
MLWLVSAGLHSIFSAALVKLWILLSVWASAAGWLLSALRQLNSIGYLFALALFGILMFVRRRGLDLDLTACIQVLRKGQRRFRHGLPAGFALLAVLVLIGGCLYAPTNHTALTYRIPRVLNWLAEGHWHWIYTDDYRLNNRACGIEWLSAPLLLFTRSDRALFLLNFIPFILMPGQIYSLFIRLGVRRRVAWQWMWLIPTGYSFVLQAGSGGNDMFPVTYALAALDFALRAWDSRRLSDISYSALAAALLVGAKASNLPLLLPWAVAFAAASWRTARAPRQAFGAFKLILVGTPIILLTALVSFLPTAILNIVYIGDWSGLKLEHTGMSMKNPVVGVWGNFFLFLLNNLVPPFFPWAGWWNRSALTVLPQGLVGQLENNFEQGWHQLWELPTEDWAGLGFGVSMLLLLSSIAAVCSGAKATGEKSGSRRLRWFVIICSWLALLAYSAKSGMVTGARLISPYYPMLLPLALILPGQKCVVRLGWVEARCFWSDGCSRRLYS